MSGRPISRARALLSNPRALRAMGLQQILDLLSLTARARKNPDPDGDVGAAEYINARHAALRAKARKYNVASGHRDRILVREPTDVFQDALVELIGMRRLIPGPGGIGLASVPLVQSMEAWDAEFERLMEAERKTQWDIRDSNLELRSAEETDSGRLAMQEQAEAKNAVAEAEGDLDLFPSHRFGSKEIRDFKIRQILTALPNMSPRQQLIMVTWFSGSLNALLAGDRQSANFVLRKVERASRTSLSPEERSFLLRERQQAQHDLVAVEALQDIVLEMDEKRPAQLPPGDIPEPGAYNKLTKYFPDTPRVWAETRDRIRSTFRPARQGHADVTEDDIEEVVGLRAPLPFPKPSASNNPTWRRAPRYPREPR